MTVAFGRAIRRALVGRKAPPAGRGSTRRAAAAAP
jgi:hypothetical protein